MKDQKITPCLWFDDSAEAAANFYVSNFSNSEIGKVARYGKEGFEFHGREEGTAMTVEFFIDGQKFIALNGGPMFKINPSISFFVKCETPEEVERSYLKLIEGGTALLPLDVYPWSEKYGWVQDKFGVNWQIFFGPNDESEQKFSPCMMFTGDNAGRAEEAINHYTGIFEDSSAISISRYEAGENDVEGTIKHAIFSLNDQTFRAMDSSLTHEFTFSEGVSMVVDCGTQEEIDYFWGKLTEGGSEGQCGWLKDKFGVSWQVVPKVLAELMSDSERSVRVVAAFMKMKKFDIQTLLEA